MAWFDRDGGAVEPLFPSGAWKLKPWTAQATNPLTSLDRRRGKAQKAPYIKRCSGQDRCCLTRLGTSRTLGPSGRVTIPKTSSGSCATAHRTMAT